MLTEAKEDSPSDCNPSPTVNDDGRLPNDDDAGPNLIGRRNQRQRQVGEAKENKEEEEAYSLSSLAMRMPSFSRRADRSTDLVQPESCILSNLIEELDRLGPKDDEARKGGGMQPSATRPMESSHENQESVEEFTLKRNSPRSTSAEELKQTAAIASDEQQHSESASSPLSFMRTLNLSTEVVRTRDSVQEPASIIPSSLIADQTKNVIPNGIAVVRLTAANDTFGDERSQSGGRADETGRGTQSSAMMSTESSAESQIFVPELPLERNDPRSTSWAELDQAAADAPNEAGDLDLIGESTEFGHMDPLSTLLNETSDGYRIVRPGVVRVTGMAESSFSSDETSREEEERSELGDGEPPHHPRFFPVEAQLVPENPDREVQELRERLDYFENQTISVQAEPMPDNGKDNQTPPAARRQWILRGLALMCVIALVAILGAVLWFTMRANGGGDTNSSSPSPTLFDANTDAPPPTPTRCFNSTDELRVAIGLYLDSDQFTAQILAERYGSPVRSWCVSKIQNFSGLFAGAESFNDSLSGWDTSSAVDMSNMFRSASSFDQDISALDVSNVEMMSNMFDGATAFNQDLSVWDTSSAVDMSNMFRSAFSFDQDISAWDVSNVETMSSMFKYAAAFNHDLSVWNTSSAVDMSNMFRSSSFDHDISAWDVSTVKIMSNMFDGTTFNQNLSTWDVSSVSDMREMFRHTTSFNQDISLWDVSRVKNMFGLFGYALAFDQDVSAWDVSNVETMSLMFEFAAAFNQDLSTWNVSNVNTMDLMFYGALSFNQDLFSWDVSSVETMHLMFYDAKSFNQDISSWDVSNVAIMRALFNGASSFDQDISAWNVSTVKTMSRMFEGATSFNQDLSNWNVSNVLDMSSMFFSASSFNHNLSRWDVSRVQDIACMFWGASSLAPWNGVSWLNTTSEEQHCISLTNGTFCGGGHPSNGVCSDGRCCSEWGWCGNTPPYCNW